MQEENSKKMDVSYGVEKQEDSADLSKKPVKKTKKSYKKKKTVKAANKKAKEAPKKKTLIEEINEMKANNPVNTPEFREKRDKLEVILALDGSNPFGTNGSDIV